MQVLMLGYMIEEAFNKTVEDQKVPDHSGKNWRKHWKILTPISFYRSGINKITQKVGEEAVELVIEVKDNDAELFKIEAAGLMYRF